MRISAAILHRGRPPRGGTIAAEETRLHGEEAMSYSIKVLQNYCERIEIVEATSEECLEGQLFHILKGMVSLPVGAPDFVLLHDAARPLITRRVVEDVIASLLSGREIVVATAPTRDPILIGDTLTGGASLLQTPEGFPFTVLLKAHEWRVKEGKSFANGTQLVSSWLGVPPTLIPQEIPNHRIESYTDIAAVEGVLKFGQVVIVEDPRDLRGVHVLLLGGSGGIGKACIEALEELGATCHAPSRQEVDLTQEQDFADLGMYQAVIHAAGEYAATPEEIMRVNFFSCLNLLSRAEARKWKGNIVFLSSSSSTWGRPGIPVYSASKSALNALIESEAERLADSGIIINVIAPGKVNTRLQSVVNPSLGTDAMLSPKYVARVVTRYLATKQFGRLIFLRKGFDVA